MKCRPVRSPAQSAIAAQASSGRYLAAHKLGSPFSGEDDFVFTDAVGLNGPDVPKIHSHDLRHTFASILIREGADVVFISRQLGHANPSITLRIHAHLFGADEQATRLRDALEKRFRGNSVVTKDGSGEERTGEAAFANVVTMRAQRVGSSSD
jgi:hypothetical protein